MKLEMKEHTFPGKLITFCGLDGCGKTTQINRLVKWLKERGYKVYLTKQPTDSVRKSEMFRAYNDSTNYEKYDYRAVSLLCASDRIQHSNIEILEKLKEGYIVISDRYFYSCLANLIARGYKEDLWIYDIAKYIPKPDLAIFLDLPADEAIKRVRKRPEEKEKYIDEDFQEELRELYLKIGYKNDGFVLSTLLLEEICFERIIFKIGNTIGIHD